MKRFHFLFYLLLLLLACQATDGPVSVASAPGSSGSALAAQGRACEPSPATRSDAKKVLFVGNSLTYTNDLPSLVAGIGARKGVLIEKEMLAFANYALEDHWNEGCIQKLIMSGYYDFVVVQQGPSSQADGRKMLLEYGALIQELCVQHDTKLAFFMVWPARVNYQTFDGMIRNYTDAALTTGSLLCPAGWAWKQYIDRTGDFSHYGPDDLHPSLSGSQVAAEVIYKALFP